MASRRKPAAAADVIKAYSFDLTKISLDELLDVFELADQDLAKGTTKDAVRLLRTMRKCLIQGSTPLTGADLAPVLEGFMAVALGGGVDSKNLR